MSSAYASQYYATTGGSMPMPVPAGKDQYVGSYYPAYPGGHSTYSVSPPESETAQSSASGGPPSYSSNSGYSSYSGYSPQYSGAASYAGSTHGDYDSAGSMSGLDFNEYVQDRCDELGNPIAMDSCLAKQAQTSGALNAKQRELLELQKKTQARLGKSRRRFAEGMADAHEVRADLEWTHQKVTSLQAKASKKHSKEYKKARERYPSPDY